MNRFLVAAAALTLLAGPALAQTSESTTETTHTVTAPAPVYPAPPPPMDSSTSYKAKTVTHSDNGYESKDTASMKEVAPDGSTVTKQKVIEESH